jgi:hypothetical protein
LLIEWAKKPHKGKKFWEEQTAYFLFAKISVSDKGGNPLVCMRYEVNIALQLARQYC